MRPPRPSALIPQPLSSWCPRARHKCWWNRTVRDLTLRLSRPQFAAIDAAVQTADPDSDGAPMLRLLRQGVRGQPPSQGVLDTRVPALDDALAVTLADQVWRVVLRVVGEDLSRQRIQLDMLGSTTPLLSRELEMEELQRTLDHLAAAHAELKAQLHTRAEHPAHDADPRLGHPPIP